jgi:hypothetical protein
VRPPFEIDGRTRGANAHVAGMIPSDIVEQVPLCLFGLITGPAVR